MYYYVQLMYTYTESITLGGGGGGGGTWDGGRNPRASPPLYETQLNIVYKYVDNFHYFNHYICPYMAKRITNR